MSSECVICGGNRFVKLPVMWRLSARVFDSAIPMMPAAEEAYRTYPCPECNQKTAAEEKVGVVYADASLKRGPAPADAKKAIAESLAKAIALHLLKEDFIEIMEEKRGDDTLFVAKCAVVSPKTATRIESRAFDKMKEFLGNVAEEAADCIAVWGSSYTGNEGMISKGQAIDYMRASFDRHLHDAALKEHEEGKAG